MRKINYPITLHPTREGRYVVDIPDWNIATQGTSMEEAKAMAKDAIELMAEDMPEQEIPAPHSVPAAIEYGDIATMVEVEI
ncbi:MAG: type II toxin-antitoxin system HicB family antitoxin [Lachnospiraceae bacterium]|nr:type II toxin-antitoxin system HicB family antitoxin [Lachnospiraceae bacterium]